MALVSAGPSWPSMLYILGWATKNERLAMTDKPHYQVIADKIISLIRDGTYPPGSRLPAERELAKRFEVGRVVIREAEIALQAQGIINIKNRSGATVLERRDDEPNSPDFSPLEVTEARLLLESESAALAARNISEATLERLDVLVGQIKYDNPDGEQASQKADREFHLAIAAASGNATVQHLIELLWTIRTDMPIVRGAHETVCAIEDATNRQQEHADVLDALRARNPDAARKAMQKHFTRLLEAMIEITEEKVLEETRKKSSESRQRFLPSDLLSQIT